MIIYYYYYHHYYIYIYICIFIYLYICIFIYLYIYISIIFIFICDVCIAGDNQQVKLLVANFEKQTSTHVLIMASPVSHRSGKE